MATKTRKKSNGHGGLRDNSGRKLKYGEDTCNITFRCPVSKTDALRKIVNAQLKKWIVTGGIENLIPEVNKN